MSGSGRRALRSDKQRLPRAWGSSPGIAWKHGDEAGGEDSSKLANGIITEVILFSVCSLNVSGCDCLDFRFCVMISHLDSVII